jgi:hypothetical protein
MGRRPPSRRAAVDSERFSSGSSGLPGFHEEDSRQTSGIDGDARSSIDGQILYELDVGRWNRAAMSARRQAHLLFGSRTDADGD